jgi:hypothetical protein
MFSESRSGRMSIPGSHSFSQSSGASQRQCKAVSGRFGVIREIEVLTGPSAMTMNDHHPDDRFT